MYIMTVAPPARGELTIGKVGHEEPADELYAASTDYRTHQFQGGSSVSLHKGGIGQAGVHVSPSTSLTKIEIVLDNFCLKCMVTYVMPVWLRT